MEKLRELLSEFWPYTRGDRLRLLGGGLLSLVLVGAELGTVIIFEAIVGRVLERHHLTGFWVLAGARLSLAGLLAFAACLAYLYPPVQSLSGLVLSRASATRTPVGQRGRLLSGGNASGSAWPGPSCGTPRCWSWTSRPPAWTRPARGACLR